MNIKNKKLKPLEGAGYLVLAVSWLWLLYLSGRWFELPHGFIIYVLVAQAIGFGLMVASKLR